MAETSRESNGDPRFLFFSSLLGRPVAGPGGEPAGRVTDLVVNTVEPYPPVESLVVRRHGSRLQVPWSAVEMSATGLRLKPGAVLEEPLRERATDRLPIAEELLDRQIVDVEGAKLVRVNDLHFLEVKGALRLVHVDVGFRGLVRRLGLDVPTMLVDWRAPSHELLGEAPFDLVVAADVLYEARNVAPLCELLPRLVARGSEVVVADPRRPDARAFLDRLAAMGWEEATEDVRHGARQDEAGAVVRLHRLKPQSR